jgi:hypothetical protein
MGRPSDYNTDIATRICERRAAGESLRSICRDDDMPSTTAVMHWLLEHDEFRAQYAESCEIDADLEFDALNDIADAATPADVQVRKLQIDTRKWCLARRSPKKYGDRQAIEHTGGESPVRIIYEAVSGSD